ncbi:MAG TPA: ABC transporter permease subunit [Planctomycetota bacterium]|nr:ABC transporter permease subunit [Planctomycetota bacterium]
MRETLVVFRRELKSYFLSPIAYVFGILFLVVVLYFASLSSLVQGSQASMQPFFGLLPIVFLIFLPALTMRLWAEERKLGTIELLMTFPVRSSQLVLGKFTAALAYLAFVLVLTLGLPLTLGAYGRIDWPPVVGAYTASLLFAGSFVAVGMFWSSVTRDQIIAMLLSFGSLIVLYALGYPVLIELLAGWLPAVVVDLLNGISPYKYFESIARGIIDTRDVVYFACFCGFFLYANALVLRVRRLKG